MKIKRLSNDLRVLGNSLRMELRESPSENVCEYPKSPSENVRINF